MARWRFDGIGTGWEVETDAAVPPPLRRAVSEAIGRFDREWSRFREDSLVARLSRAGGSVPAPGDAVGMLDAYAALSDATDGGVNPLVGDSLAALGYDRSYSFRAGAPRPAPEDWRALLTWSEERLTLAAPATIDVGALGKGRLVDRVLAVLGDAPGSVVVDASGDLAVRGDPVRVALEHPFDTTRAIGTVTLRDQALCASATNRRRWGGKLHHVLDARTGEPVRTIAATWALAAEAMRADAVASALFFPGAERLAAGWGVEWVRMTTAGTVEWSPGWPGELFRSDA